ncbi:hypothetical protein DTO271D3_5518 [Paecilomyces variotii]|nr:hypothetical protein DTO271D3_5518 [Paecilomyces variotii]KAJ9387236.1 hypothetical protein DTO063F5_3331 [Paecilomyces variotii]
MRSPIYTILVLLIASVSTLAAVPAAPTGSATSGYPDKAEITKIFTSFTEGDYPGFFSHLAPNFTWTMMGTHPLAGQYHNVTIFAVDTLKRLGNVLRTSPAPSTKLLNVIGGNSEWSVQEVYGTGVCKNDSHGSHAGIPVAKSPKYDPISTPHWSRELSGRMNLLITLIPTSGILWWRVLWA